MFSADLTRAEAMAAEGNEEACLPAVRSAMQYAGAASSHAATLLTAK
jgi:hypothetical protein